MKIKSNGKFLTLQDDDGENVIIKDDNGSEFLQRRLEIVCDARNSGTYIHVEFAGYNLDLGEMEVIEKEYELK